jgi:hypothetical protein
LSKVRRDLERWRQRRNRPMRIPEAVWAVAVELADERGVAPISRALRLDYYSLKKRLQAAREKKATPAPTFVEVVAGEFSPGPAECVLEVEEAGGARMRIQLKGGAVPDLVALVRAFRPESS